MAILVTDEPLLEAKSWAFKRLIFYSYEPVLCAFHQNTRATIMIKYVLYLLYMHENVKGNLELPYDFCETKWIAFKNLILFGYERVLCDFHRKTRATITMKVIKYVLYMRKRVFSSFELQYIFWRMNSGNSKIFFLYSYGRVLWAFHRKKRATVRWKLYSLF